MSNLLSEKEKKSLKKYEKFIHRTVTKESLENLNITKRIKITDRLFNPVIDNNTPKKWRLALLIPSSLLFIFYSFLAIFYFGVSTYYGFLTINTTTVIMIIFSFVNIALGYQNVFLNIMALLPNRSIISKFNVLDSDDIHTFVKSLKVDSDFLEQNYPLVYHYVYNYN